MANKTLASSHGYFNKDMLTILKKGEKKSTDKKKSSTGIKKNGNKK